MSANVTPIAAAPERPKKHWLTRFGEVVAGMVNSRQAEQEAMRQGDGPFTLPRPYPGVVPQGSDRAKLAMDELSTAVKHANDYACGAEGQAFATAYGGWDQASFLGYAFLAQLSQIPEFRKPAQILADEMTRKWGEFKSTSKDDAAKDKLKKLTDAVEAFGVQGVVNKAFELDNFFGISHVFIDTGVDPRANPQELATKLAIDKAKVGKGGLKGFRCVEPMWVYPNTYNALTPLAPDFYSPTTWFVMGAEVHKSRLLQTVTRPVPDMLKPAYLFGGLSLTQMMMPYVQNWLGTRQSVSRIISNFSTPNLETDLDVMTQTNGAQMLALRGQIYNTLRDNQGLFVTDKEKEGFKIESAQIGGLEGLQAQAIEQMAFPAGIPLVKLLGVTPSGLNASSDGEVRVFYDSIASLQEKVGTPLMKVIMQLLQLHLFGEVDPGITWEWAQLWELDEERASQVRKTEAETDLLYVEAGIVDGQAIHDKLVADPQSPYAGMDIGEMPEPELDGDPGAEGLEPSQLMGDVTAKSLVKNEEEDKGEEEPRSDRFGGGRRGAETGHPAETAEQRATRERAGRGDDRRGDR